MSRLDRAIEAISPAWGLRRAAYRSAIPAIRNLYDAARGGRETAGWQVSGSSANLEIARGGRTIRNQVRDLVRNNPWAAQAVRKLAAKTIGTGITPRLGDEVAKDERAMVQGDWDAFCDHADPEGQLDFYGITHLAARTFFESGEVLVRYVQRPSSWGLRVPLQMQVLEPDWLDSSRDGVLANGNVAVQGVEYDRDARRVAYWLLSRHPGDPLSPTGLAGGSTRVPAAQIRHVFDPLRPGQARGVSSFTPAVLKLRNLDDFDSAELLRKKIAACFAAFVKRAAGPAAGPLSGISSTDSAGRQIEDLAPGMVSYLNAGDDVTFATPPSADGYLEFMRMQLHAIAAGVGSTYELLTGDLSQTNYSSYRAGLIDFWDLVDHWQWQVMIPQLCAPTWRQVNGLMVARGMRPAGPGYRARWTPPRRRWVDPVKEVGALKDAVRSGFVTLYDAIAEQGEDPEERLDEMERINAALDQRGILLDSDPRRAANGAPTPANDAGPPADEQQPRAMP